jgi:hypothetical protein
MKFQTELYQKQESRWPQQGKVILAQFDDTSIIVYQAYQPGIGHFAAQHGFFGGDFSYDRMSWIKPNFLWMMYRSGWGTKPGQEVILAVRLKRQAFDYILAQAVPSSYHSAGFPTRAEWQTAVQRSEVRLQWDPDHGPGGAKLERRAIQLGLRDEVLRQYGREWLVEIEDISAFVREQRETNLFAPYSQLLTPTEDIYPVKF